MECDMKKRILSFIVMIVMLSSLFNLFTVITVNAAQLTSGQVEGAINWAYSKKNAGDTSYSYWCLKFVSDAWYSQGVSNSGYSYATLAGNAMISNTDQNPPRGATVFWDWYGTVDGVYQNWGHVGISLGDGKVIHADSTGIRVTGLYLDSSRQYRGWGVWAKNTLPSTTATATAIHQDANAHVRNGFFTLKNASSGKYMNVYGGKDENKTSVTMWTYDDSTDQQFNIVHKGNGKYKLYAVCSSNGNNRVVDVYRGNDAPAAGDVVDLWTPDDDTSQLFYIVPMDDDSYVFELAAKNGYVIAPTSASAAGTDNAQLTLQKYTGASYQKWKLCNNNGKETFALGSYTAGSYKVDTNGVVLRMRNGAGTSYSQVGTVADGTVLSVSQVNGNWGYTSHGGVSGWVCLDFAVYTVTINSISISVKPNITTYFIGDTLDTTGLKLSVSYSNGSSKTISSGYTTSADLNTAGSKTVTVSYSGKTTTFTITVQSPVVSELGISTQASKKQYYVGDKLDTSGLTISATYNNGSTKTITSGFTTSCDLSTSGTKTVTVSYGGKSTSYQVTVQDVVISSLSISAAASKTKYNVGESIDTSGLVLLAKYNNGTEKSVTSGFTANYDFSTAGTKIVTISYAGKNVTYNVVVENPGQATIQVIATEEAYCGDEIAVNVNLINSQYVYDGNFNIVYDNAILELQRYTKGDNLINHNVQINSEYADNIARISFAGTDEVKNGTMISLVFKVISDSKETTSVSIAEVNMYNVSGSNIDTTIQNADTAISKCDYTINSMYFMNSNDEYVNSIQGLNEFYVGINFNKNSEGTSRPCIIFALYDESDNLIDVKIVQNRYSQGNKLSSETMMEISDEYSPSYVSVFIFEDFERIKPLCRKFLYENV